MNNIRILLVDDHPIFRDGLRRLLEAEPGLQVVGEAGSGREALRRVAELAPDVVLLDLSMPDGSGFDVLRALAGTSSVRTILLTADAKGEEVLEAVQLGARGLVLKHAATATLTKCIPLVMSGEYWFGRDRMPDLVHALRHLSEVPSASPAETLTRRERHVINAVASGSTNRDIAADLGLSEQTVKNYLSHIFDKVGVSNRLELALYAIHHKLTGDSDLLSRN